jgi:8-oxo-dGTP diphosphatase
VRPSAYALVLNEPGNLAVVRTAQGCFLPGGGIQLGETPEQTVEREAREECGLLLESRAIAGRAVEIVYSAEEDVCFEKRGTFIEADVIGMTLPAEVDHELIWLDPIQAIKSLSHESHCWAVGRLIR